MPVSKKRKPKRRNSSPIRSSSAASGGSSALSGGAASKKKLSRQQIIIYVISIVMILSLAIGYLVGNGRGAVTGPAPTLPPVIAETPSPAAPATNEAALTPTAEPTEAN